MYLNIKKYISMYYPPFNTRSGHKSLGQREICLGFKIKKVGDTSLGALLTFFPFQSSSMMHTSRPITLRILNGSICEHISCPNINVPCLSQTPSNNCDYSLQHEGCIPYAVHKIMTFRLVHSPRFISPHLTNINHQSSTI